MDTRCVYMTERFEKSQNLLKTITKSKEKNGKNRFFLSSSILSFSHGFFRGDFENKSFLSTCYLRVNKRSELTKDEYANRCDLMSAGIFTFSGELADDYESNLEVLVNYFKSYFKREHKRLLEHYIGKQKNWNAESQSDLKVKEALRFLEENILFSETFDKKIKKHCYKLVQDYSTKNMYDMSKLGESVYLLNMMGNVDEAIKKKEFFNIEEYNYKGKTTYTNGEFLKFEGINGNRKNFTIRNTYEDIHMYIDHNAFICLSREEALEKGRDKLNELKRSMMAFERCVF